MPRISNLVETAVVGIDDFFPVSTSAGTRKARKRALFPRLGDLTAVLDTDINILNDFIPILDASDSLMKRVSVRNLVFGDYDNVSESDTFTLDPALHGGGRPVQLTGTFTTPTVFLDGNLAIDGTAYTLANFSSTDITVTPVTGSGVSIRTNGVSANGIVRIDRAATLIVSNGGGVAIFSGG